MGRINKTKAGVALLVGLVGFGATGVAVAQGGLTANLALSGTFFKISMTHLEGEGLSIFTDGEQMAEEAVPVARVKFEHAYASNLCLSAALPDVPLVGESTFTLKALGDNSVEVEDLVVGATDIKGALDLTDASVGADASQFNSMAQPNAWSLHANKVTLRADDIRATSVGAKRLAASGVAVDVKRGMSDGCAA